MEFLVLIAILLVGFVWLDNQIFSKSDFSLRNSININFYSDKWTMYNRASYLFTKYPSQNKIDVMIKYGLYPSGTTRIPDPISSSGIGSYSFTWRKHFDEKGKAKDGSDMCNEIIRLHKS